jgi:hypothetical protein
LTKQPDRTLDDLFTGGWNPGATTWRRDSLQGIYAALAEDHDWITFTPTWNVGSTTSNATLLDCVHLRKEAMTEFTAAAVDGWLARRPE